MAVATINTPANFEQALDMLGTKTAIKIGHNTYLTRINHGTSAAIMYHGNTIATYSPLGLVVTLAGWDTMTTRGHLHQIPGVRCYRVKGQTFINDIPVSANQLVEIGC